MKGRSRRDYLEVIYSRYRQAGLPEKQVILNQFCRNAGYNRQYAIPAPSGRSVDDGSVRPATARA
jgi:hypothetical protein